MIRISLMDHYVIGEWGGREAGVRSTIAAQDWVADHERIQERDETELLNAHPGCHIECDWWTETYYLTYDTCQLGDCE